MKNKSKQLISTLDEELRKQTWGMHTFLQKGGNCMTTELLQIAMIILNKFFILLNKF